MTMPTYVVDMVDQGRRHMLAHPQHALTPMDRYSIYKAFWKAAPDHADAIYRQLCLMTAKHVLSLWEEIWPEDRLPHSVLDTIAQLEAGSLDRLEAEEVAQTIGEELESRTTPTLLHQEISALCAAEAVLSSLWTALGRSLFGGVTIESTDTDADIDPWSSDTALWAVTAVAGGVWDPESNSGKRRAFWLWWLDEVIPSVWHTKGDTQLDLK